MNKTIDLPELVYTELVRAATARGTTPAEWIQEHLPKRCEIEDGNEDAYQRTTKFDHLLDSDFLANCAKEADPSITLESVRQALSKIPGSMTDDFIAEREER